MSFGFLQEAEAQTIMSGSFLQFDHPERGSLLQEAWVMGVIFTFLSLACVFGWILEYYNANVGLFGGVALGLSLLVSLAALVFGMELETVLKLVYPATITLLNVLLLGVFLIVLWWMGESSWVGLASGLGLLLFVLAPGIAIVGIYMYSSLRRRRVTRIVERLAQLAGEVKDEDRLSAEQREKADRLLETLKEYPKYIFPESVADKLMPYLSGNHPLRGPLAMLSARAASLNDELKEALRDLSGITNNEELRAVYNWISRYNWGDAPRLLPKIVQRSDGETQRELLLKLALRCELSDRSSELLRPFREELEQLLQNEEELSERDITLIQNSLRDLDR